MKKRYIVALALGMMICLNACQKAPVESQPETPTATPTQVTVPPTTVPETTVPEPELEAGDTVTVDGTVLEGGSVIYEDCIYVKATEFLSALDHSSHPSDATLGLKITWGDSEIELDPQQLGPVIDGKPYPLTHEMMLYRDALYLPLEEFCQMLEISILDDADQGHLYCTSGIMNLEIPEGVHVPVLMYHAVSDDLWGFEELFVSPSDMEEQLAYLVDNGYDPIFFEDLDHVQDYDKPVILTFDDGYLDNYTELYPLLQKYNVKATVFVITSTMGVSKRSMTREQVKELSDSGLVSIQSHTVTHSELSSLDYDQQLVEIRDSKLEVTRMTGREPHVLCYPSGERNEISQQLAAEYYNFGIDMNGGLYTTGEDRTSVSRYYVSRYTSLGEFASMVSNAG